MRYTEFAIAAALSQAAQEPAYRAAFISPTRKDSAAALAIAATLGPGTLAISNSTVTMANGGRVFFRPCTTTAARGLPALHEIYLDCCDRAIGFNETYAALLPCLEPYGQNAKLIRIVAHANECWKS